MFRGLACGALVALFSSYPGVVAQVQDGPAVIIGHEFLDALPVHQFQVRTCSTDDKKT